MDSEQGEQRQAQRRRRTLYLVAGGVLSLLLPLLGALYLKLGERSGPSGGVDASAVFARREGVPARVQPAGAPAAAALPAPAAGAKPSVAPSSTPVSSESGLSMIRGGQDYYQEPAKAPAPAPAKPAPAPAPKPIPEPKPAAPAPQPFSFAKLKPAAGFGQVRSWFSGGQQQPPAAPAGQAPLPSAGTANNPPDMNALMNSMRGAGGPAAGGAVGQAQAPAVPDVNALLKSMQTSGAPPSPNQQ